MTTENLFERVSELEKSVKRAAEAIALLRKERDSLQAKVTVMEGERALPGLEIKDRVERAFKKAGF